eukprot:790787-Prymnesium_polylepis.2
MAPATAAGIAGAGFAPTAKQREDATGESAGARLENVVCRPPDSDFALAGGGFFFRSLIAAATIAGIGGGGRASASASIDGCGALA